MSEAETKTERVLYLIKYGQGGERRQGDIGIRLQDLVVKIVRIEANHQVRFSQAGEQRRDGLRRIHLIAPLPCVIRHRYAKTKEVFVLPTPNILGAFLGAQYEIEVAWPLGLPGCGALGHTGEGWYRLTHQPLEQVNARLALQALVTLAGITLVHGHAPAAAVGTVTVQEDL